MTGASDWGHLTWFYALGERVSRHEWLSVLSAVGPSVCLWSVKTHVESDIKNKKNIIRADDVVHRLAKSSQLANNRGPYCLKRLSTVMADTT